MIARAGAILVLGLIAACGSSATRNVSGKVGTPKLPPADPQALRHFDAAMRALRLGGPEADTRAVEKLTAAVQADRRMWEAWHNLGVIAARKGDSAAAADAFSKALAINPAHVPTLTARAEVLRTTGDTDKARADYRRAMSLMIEDVDTDEGRKRYRDAGARLASLLRLRKRYADAVDTVREVLRVAGPNAKVFVELALVYMAQGRAELAKLVLTKAAGLNAKEPAIYNAMALLALEGGKSQEAFERFDYATSLDPSYLDARFNKAAVLLDAGDYARGKNELAIVVKADPGNLSAMVALGVAHRGLKHYDEAERVWEKVVQRAPRTSSVRADALFNLAVLEMDHRQKTPDAKTALDRYLQEAPPGHSMRKQALDRKKELGL